MGTAKAKRLQPPVRCTATKAELWLRCYVLVVLRCHSFCLLNFRHPEFLMSLPVTFHLLIRKNLGIWIFLKYLDLGFSSST